MGGAADGGCFLLGASVLALVAGVLHHPFLIFSITLRQGVGPPYRCGYPGLKRGSDSSGDKAKVGTCPIPVNISYHSTGWPSQCPVSLESPSPGVMLLELKSAVGVRLDGVGSGCR